MGAPSQTGASGFWGLILEPGKRYSRLVDVPFHITSAVLDTMSNEEGKDEIVSVMLEVDGMEVIICNLSLSFGILQAPLDLKFDVGCRIAFYSTATSSGIHLSGNVIGSKESFSVEAQKMAGKFTEKKRKIDVDKAGENKKAKNIKLEKTAVTQMLNSLGEDEEEDSFSDDMEEDSEGDEDEMEDEEDELEDEDDEGEEEGDDDEDENDEDSEETDSSNEQEESKTIFNTIAKGKQTNNAIESGTPKAEKDKTGTLSGTIKSTPKKEKAEPKGQTANGSTPKQKGAENNIKGSPQTPGKATNMKLPGGITYSDLVVGTGQEAKHGKNVGVYYEGRLASNKKMFDKCNSGKPFKFRLGSSDIIKGWSVAINGMRIGGKRKFVCPPHLGYGKAGAPPAIPPNASLEFVVELKSVGG